MSAIKHFSSMFYCLEIIVLSVYARIQSTNTELISSYSRFTASEFRFFRPGN